MSSWLGTVGTMVRTDRKSALWWHSGDFCEEESSAFLFFSRGILDIELRALCKRARWFTTELHSCGVVGSDVQPGCLLVPPVHLQACLCVCGQGRVSGPARDLGIV